MTGTAEVVAVAVAGGLPALLARRFALSVDVPHRFFHANAEPISQACLAMARRFERGGRLLVFGEGAQASDAEHVAVEFVHPVLVGKRAWAVGLNRSGSQLFVVNGLSDDVTVVDVAAARALKTVPVGRVPYMVVVDD